MEKKRLFFWILVLLTGLLGASGFWVFYGQELSSSPFWLWLFIPDSPLFACFFVLCVLLIWFKKEASWFLVLVSVGLVKYGISSIILHGKHLYLNYELTGVLMVLVSVYVIVSHLFMAFEVVFLTRYVKKLWLGVLIGLVFFLVNDYLDFFSKWAPDFVNSTYGYGSLVMTLVSVMLVLVLVRGGAGWRWRKS